MIRPLTTLLATLTVVAGSATATTLPDRLGDGWHGWRVAASDKAPSWCCYSYRGGAAQPTPCRLDDGHGPYIDGKSTAASPAQMQIFTLMRAGRIERVHAFAADCPVRATGPVTDHGTIDTASSVAHLRAALQPRGAASSPALAAIAVHDGDDARAELLRTARADTSFANRKDAVFWIGQVRANELGQQLQELMFDDPDAALREHAAFSWSQASVPDRASVLTRLARSDRDRTVRSRAWFWLAQTGAAETERAIAAALRDEPSKRVRHDAIFALSQLPGPRAVTALIAVIEDAALAQDDRRQAMFWIAQSDDDAAIDYLARVLDR